MKEIKFRAWDRFYKCWFIPLYFNFDTVFKVGYRPFHPDPPHFLEVGKECDLVQFTGLRDKNEKEIYWEDIYLESFGSNDNPRPRVVCEVTVAAWILESNKCNSPMKCVEVIGNIYSNPELR